MPWREDIGSMSDIPWIHAPILLDCLDVDSFASIRTMMPFPFFCAVSISLDKSSSNVAHGLFGVIPMW